ncbi:MAG: BlaI family penicillinase repressor [Cyclobacteriaceae bacterium]|jgi:predicted transcriptional regulator
MKELTKAEEQIMRVLWKKEKCLVRDIMDSLPTPKPAYNTVATFLKILETKGFVSRKAIANTFEYYPLVEKSTYTDQFIKGFMEKYFEGSLQKMMSFFIEKNDMDLKEFEDIQKLLNEKKNG